MKKTVFIAFFTLMISVTLYAADWSFTYCEWPDGCLTSGARGHYDYSDRHRNDNAEVRGQIDFFNNFIRQNNAISIEQQRSGMTSNFIYQISKSQEYSPSTRTYGAGGSVRGHDSEIYTMVILAIYSSSGGTSPSSGSSSSSYSPSTSSSYNPANSNYLLIGYNFAYDAPIGLTIADSMFFKRSLVYISANLGFAIDPGKLVIEWTYGVAISVTNWLRIPIGIGGNHIGKDGEKITGSSTINGNTTYYTDNDPLLEWEHAFVIEAGVQPVIKDCFYLSATYRLIGFSKSGFTIGAGVIF